jgi:cholesterol transport system auxiliary component
MTVNKHAYRNTLARAGKAVLAAAALASITACSGMVPGGGPAPSLYTLSPKSTFDEGLPNVTWQLVVEKSTSSGSLATQRIALTHNPVQTEYFAGARWTENAPLLVQTLMVESFENTNKIVAVGRMAIGLRSDFNLKSDLREFQAEYREPGQPPTVRVRINAKLIKQPRRQIVASRTFERRVKAKGTDMHAVVRAFDKALGKVIKRVVQWTLQTGHEVGPAKRRTN